MLKQLKKKVRHVLKPGSYQHLFLHAMPQGLPHITTQLMRQPIDEKDRQMVERIFLSYEKARNDSPDRQDQTDMWDLIQTNKHHDLNVILKDADIDALHSYLADFHQKGLAHGITDFNKAHLPDVSPVMEQQQRVLVVDTLVAVAEYLGVFPYQSVDNYIYRDTEEIFNAIQNALSIDIIPPNVDGGIVKVKVGPTWFSYREAQALYVAHRVASFKPKKIAEIGGGFGCTTLYAMRFGCQQYYHYDLPTTNIAQAWYLYKTGHNVSLYGEPEAEVNIRPYWNFGETTYDVTLNIDSFSELDESFVRSYLSTMQQATALFFSLNKETEKGYGLVHGGGSERRKHVALCKVVKDYPAFQRLYRAPAWTRKNYVEEVFTIEA